MLLVQQANNNFLKAIYILLFFYVFGIIILGDGMNNSKSKSDLFYFIVLILTLIIMVIGVTFTYFSLIASDKEDSTIIKTGTLAINYVDGNAIDTYALMPINEPDLSTEYSVYKKNFSVRSTGTLDQTLDIYMYITNNQFDDNILGYSLYDSVGNKLSKGDIPKNGRILLNSGIYLKSNEEKKFTVLIWLKENNKQQDYEMGKTFTGGFDITASQIKYK